MIRGLAAMRSFSAAGMAYHDETLIKILVLL